MSTVYDRDLIGYGPTPPDPKWPNGARLALNFVINVEEGSEPSVQDGEGYTEVQHTEAFGRQQGLDGRDLGHPTAYAAARAGMGTFGKNCLFYSNKVARQSSWVLPIAVVVDHPFAPDAPTIEMGCPDWCRNTCIAACPTRALKGNGTIDPRRCISFLTYFGDGLTPRELREPMGLYIYGCDRCQNVCPRNAAWLAEELPVNPRVVAKEAYFRLERLLSMDKTYFEAHVRPHMFYMSWEDSWRWKMNVARVMGYTLDPMYIDDLIISRVEYY